MYSQVMNLSEGIVLPLEVNFFFNYPLKKDE